MENRKKKGLRETVIALLVLLVVTLMMRSFLSPETDYNPRVNPEDIAGTWVRGSQTIKIKVFAVAPNPSVSVIHAKYSGTYQFEDRASTTTGEWTLEDWHLRLSRHGQMRVVKVGQEFQIVDARPRRLPRLDNPFRLVDTRGKTPPKD